MSISEVTTSSDTYSHTAIKHAISSGVDIDMDSKPDFAKPVSRQSHPGSHSQRSQIPELPNMVSEYIWDLWGPVSVKSLSGNYYVIDDHTHKNRLYFQPKKSDTIKVLKGMRH